jgi:hypothetical protein
MWKAWLIGALGIWMAIAPMVTGSSRDHLWNNWIVGLIVTNVALMMSSEVRWERLVGAGAGIWLFASGFIPRLLTGRGLAINNEALALVLITAAAGFVVHYHRVHRAPEPMS